tara:strand:+ start:1187 stop:1300 length:114 start_codon:yes stop_codon:yes gene_type:complete
MEINLLFYNLKTYILINSHFFDLAGVLGFWGFGVLGI